MVKVELLLTRFSYWWHILGLQHDYGLSLANLNSDLVTQG
jgi:hypothetical protein